MPWPRAKASATARGLGKAHRDEKARLLPLAYGRDCPYAAIDPQCPGQMTYQQKLELDHGRPRALGGRTGDGTGRIAHADCNHRAGMRLGAQLRWAKRRPVRRSRDW